MSGARRVLGSGFWVLRAERARIVGVFICLATAFGLMFGCAADESETDSTESVEQDWRRGRGFGRDRDHRGNRGTCSVGSVGDEVTFEVSARSHSPHGELSLRGSHRLNRLTPEHHQDVVVRLDGRTLMRVVFDARADGSIRSTIDYEPPFRGARHAALESDDLQSARVTVDGRESNPFQISDSPDVTFMDGRPAPRLRLAPGLRHAVGELLERARDLIEDCRRDGTFPRAEPETRETPPARDQGHHSFPENENPCLLAQGLCFATFGECLYFALQFGVTTGCPWCALGVGAFCLLGEHACMDEVLHSDICCPVLCRDFGFPDWGADCCFGDETCLSRSTGMCCSFGKEACNFDECCSPGDNCLASGCCSPEKTHGDTCCGATEVPIPGFGCCAEEDLCGTPGQTPPPVCCPEGPGEQFYCADPTNAICCGVFSQFCNGQCCPIGSACDAASGTCVPPPTGMCLVGSPCLDDDDCDALEEEFRHTFDCVLPGGCCIERTR